MKLANFACFSWNDIKNCQMATKLKKKKSPESSQHHWEFQNKTQKAWNASLLVHLQNRNNYLFSYDAASHKKMNINTYRLFSIQPANHLPAPIMGKMADVDQF